MSVVFPHANHHAIEEAVFREAWRKHCRTCGRGPRECELPRLPSRKKKAELESAGRQFSLEVLLRTLVPEGYQDTAQATRRFLEKNAHVVAPTRDPIVNPVTGRRVQGVRLLPGGSTR
jgi:hypothetical protein